MLANLPGQTATVVAEERSGQAATAQLVTSGGAGNVSVVGKPGSTVTISALPTWRPGLVTWAWSSCANEPSSPGDGAASRAPPGAGTTVEFWIPLDGGPVQPERTSERPV